MGLEMNKTPEQIKAVAVEKLADIAHLVSGNCCLERNQCKKIVEAIIDALDIEFVDSDSEPQEGDGLCSGDYIGFAHYCPDTGFSMVENLHYLDEVNGGFTEIDCEIIQRNNKPVKNVDTIGVK